MKNSQRIWLGRAAWVLAAILSAAAPGFAQVFTGRIDVTVSDSTGAVLPGVTVEASSSALIEKTRSAVSDGSGQYRITDLPPGNYSVAFMLTGFSKVVRDGLTLSDVFTSTRVVYTLGDPRSTASTSS